MSQAAALFRDVRRVVSRIHQVVAILDALRAHRGQRNGYLGVMYRRRGRHRADGDLAIGHIQMQLVTPPILLVSLTAFPAPDVAVPGQLLQHLRQTHAALPFQTGALAGHRRFTPLVAFRRTFGTRLLDLAGTVCGTPSTAGPQPLPPLEIRIAVSPEFRVGHEAHFSQAANRFFECVLAPETQPAWERPNMLAKYIVTTQGVDLGKRS